MTLEDLLLSKKAPGKELEVLLDSDFEFQTLTEETSYVLSSFLLFNLNMQLKTCAFADTKGRFSGPMCLPWFA